MKFVWGKMYIKIGVEVCVVSKFNELCRYSVIMDIVIIINLKVDI